MKVKFSIFGLFLIALLTSPALFAAIQVTATVSETQVVKGDLFILTIDINDNDNNYRLDTRSLEASFTVYRPSQSQSSEYVNGSFSQKTQWRVRLQAKKTGKAIIPALKIGNFKTDPIEINVIEASQFKQDKDTQNRTVFIENSINKQVVYIGQSFIYTTKLYLSKNSNTLDLVAPHFAGADAEVFGQDNNSQTVLNGVRYNIITRQYKLIATQVGQFDIDSPLLTGTLRKSITVNGWQNRTIAEPINVRGERLTINVKAIPKSYQGDWLVSEDLRLIENNDLTAQSYKVGDPITRSITLQIASVDKEKLPNINLNYPKSLRFYPDQDQLKEGQANGLTYGIRIISHAIIADKQGTLTLPEIKINWFNSQTNQSEIAILPAQNLTILGADVQQLTLPTTITPAISTSKASIMVESPTLIYWQISVAALIIMMLLMIAYHLYFRRLQKANQHPVKKVLAQDEHYLVLLKCLQSHDAPKCYSMLLKYAQHQYPALKSLSELADKIALDAEKRQILRHEIRWLQICCSDKSQQWNANKLSQLIKVYESTKTKKIAQETMNLNP